MFKRKKIGVFDSGIGGLSILNALADQSDEIDYIYVADSDNMPYGDKSEQEIKALSARIVDFLFLQGIDVCVIACHTISSIAQTYLKEHFLGITFYGMVELTTSFAHGMGYDSIAIFGTVATIKTHAHKKILQDLKHDCVVFEKACPDLASVIESYYDRQNDIGDHIKRYFIDICQYNINCIILACTHYPLIAQLIQKIVGPNIVLITGQENISRVISNSGNISKFKTGRVHVDFFTTGPLEEFKRKVDYLATTYSKSFYRIVL